MQTEKHEALDVPPLENRVVVSRDEQVGEDERRCNPQVVERRNYARRRRSLVVRKPASRERGNDDQHQGARKAVEYRAQMIHPEETTIFWQVGSAVDTMMGWHELRSKMFQLALKKNLHQERNWLNAQTPQARSQPHEEGAKDDHKPQPYTGR